jgi:hypothetical protein
MAIIGPAQLPAVLKLRSDPIKFEVLAQLGHPVVLVELTEDQLEQAIRVTGDFIAQYFPFEEKYAYFNTQPLVSSYNLPADAYWIKDVKWDPATTRIGDIFGAESFLFNVGNVTGIQNILLDYHMLLAYRKFSQRILGTEGQWELKGDNQIRLFPTPRGSYPVVIEYFPVVEAFRTPHAREILKRALVAEAKIMLGNARSKFGNIPAPDGGSLNLNGDALRTEGQQEKAQAVQDAILQTEPLGVFLW